MSTNAAESMLRCILQELDDMGVNDEDTALDGVDAVEYLQRLQTDLRDFLHLPGGNVNANP